MPLSRHVIDEDDPRVSRFGHAAPAWLVNYADLMTELVILFIALYTVSSALNKHVQRAKVEVKETMDAQKIAGTVKVDKEGLHITLEEAGQGAFFESGKAELTPRMHKILAQLSLTLKKLIDDGQQIIVEGHTDNIPIHSRQFRSNWELSTARATSVVHSLEEEYHLPPGPMAAIGYGEYRPIAYNDTPENRSRNRRVVFFIKPLPGAKPAPAAAARKEEAAQPPPAAAEPPPAKEEEEAPSAPPPSTQREATEPPAIPIGPPSP